MRLSDLIEAFIKDGIRQAEGEYQIQRNELAERFNCVPSQINYVIATRFTPGHGYYVNSRRGGGGSITIRRVEMRDSSGYLMHVVSGMPDALTQQTADIFINNYLGYQEISKREAALLKASVSDKSLAPIPQPGRDYVRARILKHMMMAILTA
jgi:transcriptional regulator CtsR